VSPDTARFPRRLQSRPTRWRCCGWSLRGHGEHESTDLQWPLTSVHVAPVITRIAHRPGIAIRTPHLSTSSSATLST